jgi:hypothetical protein
MQDFEFMSEQFSIENHFRIGVVQLFSSFYNYYDLGTASRVKVYACDNMATTYCRASGESLLISPTSTEIYMI